MSVREITPLFIVGSCRTGSTLLYQMIVKHFNVSYFTNLINNRFHKSPAIGMNLQWKHILDNRHNLDYSSNHGKTEGPLSPSEASYVFQHWFGGGHPSELLSYDFRNRDMEKNMIDNMNYMASITDNSTHISKNAWNIFRIEAISEAFPSSKFLWITRDIRTASYSALKSREYRGDMSAWNTATPKNYESYLNKEPYKQVVEQHRLLDTAISDRVKSRNHIKVWYEDLVIDTKDTMNDISQFLDEQIIGRLPKLKKQDRQNTDISKYVEERGLNGFCYR